jgi:hypothetical protein
MVVVDPIQLLLQIAVAYVCCIFFFCAGAFLCRIFNLTDSNEPENNERLFYSLLMGMLLTVTVYSIVLSGFKTINILILFAAVLCFRRKKYSVRGAAFSTLNKGKLLELLLIVSIFAIVFNYLPESEYKQRDSFFYLKIAEALNFTGQENVNNYYNLLSAQFHGVEAYHYFECWLGAFLIRFADFLLPNIQIFRIVTYTVITTIFIYGTFYLYGLASGKRPGVGIKMLCVSFVFFMPDIFPLIPSAISKYIVFPFENNFLERQNFRTIYLFLLPVLAGAMKARPDRKLIFFLICLSLVNPTAFAMVLPAFILLVVYQYFFRRSLAAPLLSKTAIFVFAGFTVCYVLFYYLLSGKNVPPAYDLEVSNVIHLLKKTWKFSALTITTTLLYILLFIGVAWAAFYKFFRNESLVFVRERRFLLSLTASLILAGTLAARSFPSVENIYQIAYNSYIAASVFIFILFMLIAKKSWKLQAALIIVCLSGYAANRIYQGRRDFVFAQNDKHIYSGVGYSSDYIRQVTTFASGQKLCLGAFIADSSYYANQFYSLRNPNVYHIPITYILANYATVNDFCLSDPKAIKYDRKGDLQHNSYLDNAIARSYYHRFYKSYAVTDTATLRNIKDFLLENHLQYLILTPGVLIDSVPGVTFRKKLMDPNTKERFWIIK